MMRDGSGDVAQCLCIQNKKMIHLGQRLMLACQSQDSAPRLLYTAAGHGVYFEQAKSTPCHWGGYLSWDQHPITGRASLCATRSQDGVQEARIARLHSRAFSQFRLPGLGSCCGAAPDHDGGSRAHGVGRARAWSCSLCPFPIIVHAKIVS
jgi:hypothetical protein